MNLGEAIERGYAKHPGKWGTGRPYCYQDKTYCAIGLALEGIGVDATSISLVESYNIFESYFPTDVFTLFGLNDSCTSYEDMMLKIKEAELTEVETRDGASLWRVI